MNKKKPASSLPVPVPPADSWGYDEGKKLSIPISKRFYQEIEDYRETRLNQFPTMTELVKFVLRQYLNRAQGLPEVRLHDAGVEGPLAEILQDLATELGRTPEGLIDEILIQCLPDWIEKVRERLQGVYDLRRRLRSPSQPEPPTTTPGSV